ncbi:MAG: undecaprenyl-phosphate glucose phosphotransferase [Melioribacteraceae bacterium]
MHLGKNSLYYLRILLDLFTLLAAFYISYCFTVKDLVITIPTNDFYIYLSLTVIWYITARNLNFYEDFRSRNFSYELILIIKNVLYQLLSVIIILFLLKINYLSRQFVFLYSFTLLILLIIQKFLIRKLLNNFRRKGKNLRSMLIIGAGQVGLRFYNKIQANPHFGYNVLGFLDDAVPKNLNGEYIGPISQLENVLNEFKVDNVIVALPNYAMKKIEEVIKVCENYTTRVRIIPDYFRFVSDKYSISMFDNIPIISLREERINELHCRIMKRTFDIIFSLLVILLIMSWLVPIISIIIKVTSKGPVFFKQERWGRDNKKFTILKFRSMVNDSKDVDEKGNYKQATKNDPRITKIGKFLRKTNLDELPQFFNVLIGDMSVVGPRPHPIPLNIESKNVVEHYMLRHLVKPGLTGWAQVNGYRGETKNNIKLMQKRVDYDLWYIENWSFWLDIQIIIMTIWKMIKGDPNAY